ncbi:hypothetical protein E4T56_gene1843 [Termitomyces sp. T112]|nr:hypothetical protein E4T56_gene1843 [Termitomyces sp. T112]
MSRIEAGCFPDFRGPPQPISSSKAGLVSQSPGPATPSHHRPAKSRPPLREAALSFANAAKGLRGQTVLLQQALKLAGLVHFHHDVAAAQKFALHIELGDGRPIRIGLDALTDFHVLQHVNRMIGHAQMFENGNRAAGKTTLREKRGALHEQHDIIRVHNIGNASLDIGHGLKLSATNRG